MKRTWLALSLLVAASAMSCSKVQEQPATPAAAEPKAQAPKAEEAKAAEPKAEEAKADEKSPLDTLDWMVGEWADTIDDVTVEFSCHYTKNNAFLIRPFRIVKKNGESFSGTQLIGWDPNEETIRSWTFDSNGGFGEETWSQAGHTYTIRSKYTLPDGGAGAALNVLTYVDDNTFTWKSVNREIDGVMQPDADEIKVVRKPESGEAKGGN